METGEKMAIIVMLTIAFTTLVFNIYGVRVAIDSFTEEQNISRENDLNAHISNMRSLNLSIHKNIEVIDSFLKMDEGQLLNISNLFFITKNLEKVIEDGRLKNMTIKNGLMARFIMMLQYEALYDKFNSAGFFLTEPETYEERKLDAMEKLQEELRRALEGIKRDEKRVRGYIECLEWEGNYNSC